MKKEQPIGLLVELHGKARKSRRGTYIKIKDKKGKIHYYKFDGGKVEEYKELAGITRKEQNIIRKKIKTKKRTYKKAGGIEESEKQIKVEIKDAHKKSENEIRKELTKATGKLTKSKKTAQVMTQSKNLENLRNRLLTEISIRTISGEEVIRIEAIGKDPVKIKEEIRKIIEEANQEIRINDIEFSPSQWIKRIKMKIDELCKSNGYNSTDSVIDKRKVEELTMNLYTSILKK